MVTPVVGTELPGTADAVVVGGGTVGAWCAYFLRRAGLERVVLLEKGTLGSGASSRAAGVVRVQGGTPEAVRLGRWSRRFYLGQRDELGTDSGFVQQGYLLPCFTDAEVAAARERMAMQTELGLPVRWLDPGEVDAVNPTLAPGRTQGGTFCDEDGYITPPRNVTAYTVALVRSGVRVLEHTAFQGLLTAGGRVTGVRTCAGPIHAGRVVLTGGPKLAAVGRQAGLRIPAGGVRHQVAVTEQHPDLDPARVPMVFDVTPDHLPIIGPALDPDGGPVTGVTVASAGGAGMMWGPAVARATADVALTGHTEVADVSGLGLDRFDAAGRSKLAPDPIALPFPGALPVP
jgi:sarcosine oxidase subunit beta